MPLDRIITVTETVTTYVADPNDPTAPATETITTANSARVWAEYEDIGAVQGEPVAQGVTPPTVRTRLYSVRWLPWLIAANVTNLSVTDENATVYNVDVVQEADQGRKRRIVITASDALVFQP